MTRKAAQVTAFFVLKSGGTLNVLKATKLIYLADRKSLEERDFAITNDNYASLKYGPVNTFTYSFLDGRADRETEIWHAYITPRSGYTIGVNDGLSVKDLDELSRSDIRLLESTWTEFSDIDRFQLAEWTHTYCPEWTDPGDSSSPIEIATIFEKLNKSDPKGRAKDIERERALAASFKAA